MGNTNLDRSGTTINSVVLGVSPGDPNTGLHSDGADDVSLAQGGQYVIRGNGTTTSIYVGSQVVWSSISTNRQVKVAKVALGALDTGGGVLSWANPETGDILIERVLIDVTTVSTGACTVDFGVTTASATTLNDTLIDGLDVNGATGVFDNITDKGTNGKSRQRLAAGKWVTGSKASGAAAGLVGFAYIHYVSVS